MLSEQRQKAILEMVEERHSVSATELMKVFDASESTIRRDLNQLDAEGLLVKVHGGAMAKGTVYHTADDDVTVRMGLNHDEKVAIAQFAAQLLEPGDIVYLDAGTTTELMVEFFTEKNVTFVTNACSHARKLAQHGYKVYMLGGEFKRLTEAIVGEEAILALDKYNFTKGFFGTNGITLKNGFSTPDISEALVKKKAMEKTKERFVLADSSKFSQISSVTFAGFHDTRIITTKMVDTSFKGQKTIMEVES